MFLTCVLLIGLIDYALDRKLATGPSTAIAFVFSVALSQGIAMWLSFESKSKQYREVLWRALLYVVMLLCISFFWRPSPISPAGYLHQTRWTGPWESPNIFGILMGTGTVLAVGMAIGGGCGEKGGGWDNRSGVCRLWEKVIAAGLCLVAAIFMGQGLLNSYSRGAWLGTLCGGTYLIGTWLWRLGNAGNVWNRKPPLSTGTLRWLRKQRLQLIVILAAMGALSFWHLRETDLHFVRRALSVVNSADFSWRNRIAAWEGALQITANHPWLGTGWNQPEKSYESYYLPPKLSESAAIQTNDYLMLGAMLGVPALFCFGIYIWRSLAQRAECAAQNEYGQNGNGRLEVGGLGWLKLACHAGAIVLLIGFWFDGGLFKLPTASVFWILLELGAA